MAAKNYYYNAENIINFPTSNSSDTGKLTTEENMTGIVRRITNRNYILNKTDFQVTIVGRKITVSAGECNIQGYHIITDTVKTIDVVEENASPESGWICLQVAFDGSNHARGDVSDGITILYEGAYLAVITDYNNLNDYQLVLGTYDWDGENLKFTAPLDSTFRQDSSEVKANVNIRKVDLDLTKAGTNAIMSVQDYINNVPDWYVSRFGDSLSGSLSFDLMAYQFDNRSQLGNYTTSYQHCGDIIQGSTETGIKLISIVPNDTDINVSLIASRVSLSGMELSSSVSSAHKSTSRVGYIKGSSDVFDIRHTIIRGTEKIFVNNLTMSERNVVLHSNGSLELSGYTTDNAINNVYMVMEDNLTQLKSSFYAKDAISQLSHMFGFDSTGIYPFYNLGNLSFVTGSSGYAYITNLYSEDSTVNIRPSLTSPFVNVQNKLLVGKEDTGFSSTNVLFSETDSGLTINTISLNGIWSSVRVGSSSIIDNPENSANRYSKLENDSITINTIPSGTWSLNFLRGGNLDCRIYSTKPREILIDGDLKLSGALRADKVYNAVYNDGVEFMRKHYKGEYITKGDVVCVDTISGNVRKLYSDTDIPNVIGVCSSEDSYGFALGGDGIPDDEKVPVGLFGRVYAKTDDIDIKIGDKLVATEDSKVTRQTFKNKKLEVIGKAVSTYKDGYVYMLIK